MFGLGAGEMLIILAFALIFIGPKKLPELARNLGKGLREFQNAKDEFMHHVESEKSEINHTLGEEHDPALTGVHIEGESGESSNTEPSSAPSTKPDEPSEEEIVAESKAMEEALKNSESSSKENS